MRANPRQRSRPLLVTAAQIGVMVAAYFVLPLSRGGWISAGLLIGIAVFGLFPLAVVHARRVLQSKRPLLEAVCAAAMLVSILIVGFAVAYYELAHRVDGQMAGIDTKTDALYFTVTTLTTVGYGDITATGQVARGVVTVQMLVDLAFLALGLRLLTRAVERSRERTPE